MGALSIPVQAKTIDSGNEQVDRLLADKPPTHTKRAKSTSTPRTTATPRPANTATRPPVNQNTPIPPASSTPGSQPTQIGTAGVTSSTPYISITLSPAITSVFSATPTALEMSTVVARQTETAAASFETSTALANAYSPTPTNIGAWTATGTSTPAAPERTATSVALTTSPVALGEMFVSITFIPASPALSPTAVQAPVSLKQAQTPQPWKQMYWIAIISVLLFLVYLTYNEWKKYSLQKG